MSEKERPEAALSEAFGEPYRRVMQGAVDAQQRNMQLAQGCSSPRVGSRA